MQAGAWPALIDKKAFRIYLLTTMKRASITAHDLCRRLDMLEREGIDLEKIGEEDALVFLAQGRDDGWTTAQYNNRANALNAWLQYRDRLRDAPLPLLPESLKEYRALNDEQYGAIRKQIPGMEHLRAAWCATALGVGTRPEETTRLEDEHVDLQASTFFIHKPGKRGKVRRIPIPLWVRDELVKYKAHRPARPAGVRSFFVAEHRGEVARVHPGSLGRILREEAAALGFHCNAQIARHTVATHLLRQGFDIRYVQYYLGHKNIANTARYAEVRFEDVETRFRALPHNQRDEDEDTSGEDAL